MGMFSSDEQDWHINENKRVEELDRQLAELQDENDKLRNKLSKQSKELDEAIESLKKLKSRVYLEGADRDFESRQERIFQNKVNHGFNITNVYQEARYILEETAELMRAIEKNDRENMLEELADIVIFSYGCAEVARLGNLDTKIFEKMAINESREYTTNKEGDFVKKEKNDGRN